MIETRKKLANNPTWQAVVAVALRDGSGRLLLQQRPLHKHHGGLWEFPGGKVESAESPRLALVREIAEELGIALETTALVPTLLTDDGADQGIVLFLYSCNRWRGEITAHEGQEWGWFTPVQARELPLAPMDRDLLSRLVE
jgi:8-oxo-dGTP diphosphatase